MTRHAGSEVQTTGRSGHFSAVCAKAGSSPRLCPECRGRGVVGRDLGGFSLLSWVFTVYMLSSVVCVPIVGTPISLATSLTAMLTPECTKPNTATAFSCVTRRR